MAGDGMTYLAVRYVDGRYQCYSTTDGRDGANVGPKWSTPKEASTFIDRIQAMPETSPLRPRSEPNELVVLGGMTDGSSAQNEADRTGDPLGDRLTSEDGTRVSASSQSGREPSSLGFWPD